jgi:hypothetical protein
VEAYRAGMMTIAFNLFSPMIQFCSLVYIGLRCKSRKGTNQFLPQQIGIAERGGVVEDIAFSVYFAIEEGLEEFTVENIKKVLDGEERAVKYLLSLRATHSDKNPFSLFSAGNWLFQ